MYFGLVSSIIRDASSATLDDTNNVKGSLMIVCTFSSIKSLMISLPESRLE